VQQGEDDGADRVARIQQEWRAVRPDLDVAPLGVVGRLHVVAAELTRELVALYARFGLSEAEFDLLATLRRGAGSRGAGELAAATMVTTGGLTKRLDRLESRGLVSRRAAQDDGRGRVVALTDAGRDLIDEAFVAHLENERRLLALLPDGDAEVLRRVLTGWLAGLRR
jgi:DNA-binding MarR family transcriptional regulator